ncbi:MAG: flagellar biosynthesis protein FlhF [Thermoguttaceae bacterium]|jgi:flagellar biosynthesis protein FlhF
MELKTYRARTMQEALAMVWRELGSDAAVLHTREIPTRRLFGCFPGPRQIEITASCEVNVPSRMPQAGRLPAQIEKSPSTAPPQGSVPPSMQTQIDELQNMVKQLCRRGRPGHREDLPEELFRLFTDLLDSDLGEDLARELVERIRSESRGSRLTDLVLAKARIARMIEAEIAVAGPIQVTPGHCRLAALVGPTGVGKTTTIAKLAAHYRLREKRRVGLITVDTYRIAAVEQLRTYADIIDLPMQVVSTPREMREAVRRMDSLDLVLLDTAGRSPKDEVRIQELKAFLSEADADEVHLVLSSVTGARPLEQTAERFAAVGTTALILTKLDEATGLGNILPLVRSAGLPLSYLTNGQNVPDDIETADARRLAQLILGAPPSADRDAA